MSFTDIIKKSVYEGFAGGDLSTIQIVLTLALAVGGGLFIYFVYRVSSRSGFYNRSFNKALASLPVITAGIMLAMQSNLMISLGMVGALSIVRFRNAVKDAADLTFLFWSITVGIIVGTGLFEVALLLSLCMTALVFFMDMLPTFRSPGLLIIAAEEGINDQALLACVKGYCRNAKVKSHNVTKHGIEWMIELQTKDELGLVNSIAAISHVMSVNLMSHDGELRF